MVDGSVVPKESLTVDQTVSKLVELLADCLDELRVAYSVVLKAYCSGMQLADCLEAPMVEKKVDSSEYQKVAESAEKKAG